MNELVVSSENKLSLGKFYFDKTGLTVIGDPTFEEWQNCGEFLKRAEKSVQFWIGNWLNYGEKKYGEMYTQAIDETDYEEKTLRNAKWVSSKVELSRRRDNLTFSHHAEVAQLSPQEQEFWLDKAADENLSVRDLRQAIRNKNISKDIELPTGKYSVIYADPPWQYENSGFINSAESNYPTMSENELACLSEKLNEISNDSSVLFLWATNPLLDVAMRIMQSWGFEYKTNFVWVKDKARGFAWWAKSKHELLLVGTKINTKTPEQSFDSAICANRPNEHSRKPEEFYDLIEVLFPKCKKIELFARSRRPGWDSWGNQL